MRSAIRRDDATRARRLDHGQVRVVRGDDDGAVGARSGRERAGRCARVRRQREFAPYWGFHCSGEGQRLTEGPGCSRRSC